MIFYVSFPLLLVSCWHRNEFPSEMPILSSVLDEPQQIKVNKRPFEISQGEVDYKIEPIYQYDLTGLVVSYEHHDGNRMLHKLWNDHINVADICVVWSENAQGFDLSAFDFWNGQFTCNFETYDLAAWKRFRVDQISNNHLLSEDPHIRDAIQDVRIGDQIHIRGWLTKYSNGKGFSRGTSTTRKDTGNGACETIYVKDFAILQSMDNSWRTLLNFSLFGVIASILLWLVAVQRGIF